MIYFSTEKVLHNYEPKLSDKLKKVYRSEPGHAVEKKPEDSSEGLAAYAEHSGSALEKKKGSARAFQELCAKDVMQAPVVALQLAQSLGECFEFLKKYHFRHFPVLDQEGHLVGIVSDRDIMGHSAHKKIEEHMTRKVLATDPGSSLRDMSIAMLEERVGCLPVVNKNQSLAGIVTRTDILQALITHAKVDFWV